MYWLINIVFLVVGYTLGFFSKHNDKIEVKPISIPNPVEIMRTREERKGRFRFQEGFE